MPLRRIVMHVELEGVADPVTIEAINPDLLRVESEGPKYGIPNDPKGAPQTYMTCVAWAALKRLGMYTGTLMDFKNRDCLVLDVDNPAEDEPADAVDPTQSEAGTDSR